jgi:hypothetical protein
MVLDDAIPSTAEAIVHIPKLLGNTGFRAQSGGQSKAQRTVNDWSFISVVTRHWLSD